MSTDSIMVYNWADIEKSYIRYEVYRCPTSPEKYGEYIGSTPILKQAQEAAQRLASPGGFVKGVKADGTKVILL